MFLYCIVVGATSQFCAVEAIGKKYKWQVGALICVVILAVAAGINFDITKLIGFSMLYGKYLDYVVQFGVPLLMIIFGFRLKSDRPDAKQKMLKKPINSSKTKLGSPSVPVVAKHKEQSE